MKDPKLFIKHVKEAYSNVNSKALYQEIQVDYCAAIVTEMSKKYKDRDHMTDINRFDEELTKAFFAYQKETRDSIIAYRDSLSKVLKEAEIKCPELFKEDVLLSMLPQDSPKA